MVEQNMICQYSGMPSLSMYLQDQEFLESNKLKENTKSFGEKDVDRIIEMAWEDRTPFEAIEFQFGLKEKDVVEFMRKNSLPSSFKMWRKRMKSRKTKHAAFINSSQKRFKCSRQRGIGNKISKR